MASGGAKNVVLIIIAVGALIGAVYGISTSMGGSSSPQEQKLQYYVDPATIGSGEPVGISMTVEEFRKRASAGNPIVLPNGSRDIKPAGICPNGHYYALEGHGSVPANCSTCDISLEGLDEHGNPKP